MRKTALKRGELMNPTASRFATLMGSASFLTLATALTAHAQQQVAQAQLAQAAPEIVPEQVLVTGSLIHGAAAVGVPVTNLGVQDFTQTGNVTIGDLFRAALQKQAAWLSRYAAVTVAIQGNADERGTREYNIALGARRATSVKDYLVSLGVRYDRLTTISFGKERPVCVESNEVCWSQNRRAVSAITNAAASPNNVAMRN
jgi:peptidoglycan-associated lipoprotein